MNKTVTLKTTGIDSIDNKWGGFYNGSTYVVSGPSKSGRTTLALQFAFYAASRGEVSVLFTEMRPRKLIVAAHAQGMDIQPLIDNNKLIVLRTAPLRMLETNQDRDSYLSEFLYDVLNVVNEFKPSNIIFDELTPYMDFNDKYQFLDVFTEIVESLEDMLITSLFIIQDNPGFDNSYVQKQMENIATGHIRLASKGRNSNVNNPNSSMKVVSDFGCCDPENTDSRNVVEMNSIYNDSIAITADTYENEMVAVA